MIKDLLWVLLQWIILIILFAIGLYGLFYDTAVIVDWLIKTLSA